MKTVLVQDRPMLGGNASSEMRMGIMGAHGDQNKEAGILEELQLRNFYHNPLMRYTIWDDVMLSAVLGETNVTLMLNTSVDGVENLGRHPSDVEGQALSPLGFCGDSLFAGVRVPAKGF